MKEEADEDDEHSKLLRPGHNHEEVDNDLSEGKRRRSGFVYVASV